MQRTVSSALVSGALVSTVLASVFLWPGPRAEAKEELSKLPWSKNLEVTLLKAAQLSRPVLVYVRDTV